MAQNKKNLSSFTSDRKPATLDRKLTALDCKSCLRIVDANLNRCREGLRVVEDAMRFILNDTVFYKKIRAIRHNADKILRNEYGKLLKERDSFNDSGRHLPETSKKGLSEIIIANLKRAQESLRTLEEYSKTFAPTAAVEFKKQRYLTYDIEKSIHLKYENHLKYATLKRTAKLTNDDCNNKQ
jgi:thiamine-phosphate pyrophosphorylase